MDNPNIFKLDIPNVEFIGRVSINMFACKMSRAKEVFKDYINHQKISKYITNKKKSFKIVIGGKADNGDDRNDVWNIVDIASYPNAIIQIFNRWGALVHETSGGTGYIAWDGTREGKELPVGTYYYIINLNTGDEPQTGPITIIR